MYIRMTSPAVYIDSLALVGYFTKRGRILCLEMVRASIVGHAPFVKSQKCLETYTYISRFSLFRMESH